MSLYEHDFYKWTQEQTALLKAGHLSQLDIKNLIEEVESMGKSQKKELKSRIAVLLSHLLKWDYQPGQQSSGWKGTIKHQRTEIKFLLADNPSLKRLVPDIAQAVYADAREQAAIETGLDESTFPAEIPYSLDEILGS